MNLASSNDNSQALTPQEKSVLDELELFISDNFKVFFKVGMALARIRDSRLYRQTHATFQEYCRDRFDLAARTAYQYITASDTMNRIKECAQIAHIPANESQVRPLTRLEPDTQVQAWLTVVETAPEGRITARHVKGVVSHLLGEQIRSKANQQQQAARSSAVLPEEIKEAVWLLIEQVREARLNNLSKPVRNDLKKRIEGILNLLDE
jgi:hypothetical protein